MMSSFVVLSPEKLADAVTKPVNVIATGPSRGGTTLFGALLHHLGFYLGKRVHPLVYENLDFADIAHEEPLWDSTWPQIITDLNTEHPQWALKLPHAMRRPDIFDQYAANPVFFVMMRNPLAISRSLLQRDETYADDFLFNYRRAFEHYKYFFEPFFIFLQGLKSPVVLCNYELAAAEPKKFVTDFCQLLGLEKSPKEIGETAGKIQRDRKRYAKNASKNL